MAKTVDELNLKISVDGTAQIKTATADMNNLDAAAKKTGDTLKGSQGNIRNVAFQIQDMAVQIAGGTSAFIAMGQQLPQLLGGFGVVGAAIGAIAAIAIPLTRVALSAMGVDMRNLDERTKDLTDSVKAYQNAQIANQSTLKGMGNSYGDLTKTAYDFYNIQESISKSKATLEMGAAITELKDKYAVFTDEFRKSYLEQQKYAFRGGDPGGALLDLANAFRRMNLGLTAEQAKKVADEIKNIDANKPEQTVQTLNHILKYLEESGVSAGKLKVFNDAIEPILKINQQMIEMNKNIKESGQQATAFAADMLKLQSSFMPDINASRRNFDQIGAIRKEGELRIAEYNKQLLDKSLKDGIVRADEQAAHTLRVQQDVADKVADFAKNQSETYRSAMLTNDAKMRQLEVETKIAEIQKYAGYSAEWNLRYEEDILKISKEYQDTLMNISEMRRKNTINAIQEGDLRKQALNIQKQETENARLLMNNKVQQFVDKQSMDNAVKAYDEMIARQTVIADGVKKINEQKIDLGFQASLRGLTDYERQVKTIQEEGRKAGLALQQAFAAKFTDGGDGLTPERMAELNKGLDDIKKTQEGLTKARLADLDVSQSWSTGWSDAFAKYKGDAENAAMQAKTYFDTFTSGFEDAIVRFVQTGKLSFKDLANSMIADFARVQARKMVTGLFGGEGLFSGIGKLFGFADGGSPPVNRPSIVGERGPELFIPRTAGTIVPNDMLGGGSNITNVTYSIQAVDASSFRTLIARDPEFIHNVAEQGRRSLPIRSRR